MAHVCSHKFVWTFDNFLRPLIHKPDRIFGPYVKAGMQVLDAGCGAGFATIAMARLVGDSGKVVSVDVQREMLAKVRQRSEHAGLEHRIQTHLCQSADLGIEGRFDFINAFYMVHEVPDTEAFLSQIYGLLRADGNVLIVEPKFHVSGSTFGGMLQTAEKIGFIAFSRPSILASYAVVLKKRANDSRS